MSSVMDIIEEKMNDVGLMQGEMAPLKRAGVGAAIGAAVAYGIKPTWAWDNGVPKKFGGNPGQTYFPVWMIIAAPAFILGVLI